MFGDVGVVESHSVAGHAVGGQVKGAEEAVPDHRGVAEVVFAEPGVGAVVPAVVLAGGRV